MSKYSSIVQEYLDNDLGFQEALKVVIQNSSGRIWLIGGQVFRPLLKELYGLPFEVKYDYDFLVENPTEFENIIVPEGWSLKRTGLGEPRIFTEGKQIDLIDLDNALNPYEEHDVSTMSSKEKIDSYLGRVPLNIQSIIYEVGSRELIGEIGINGIKEKKIIINSMEECLAFCARRKISVRKFLNQKIKGDIFERKYPDFENETKESTTGYYDSNSEEYVSRDNFEDFLEKNLSGEVERFLSEMKGKRVLDIGCGNGRDSILLKRKGCEPIGIDISPKMVELCQGAGIEAYVEDIENCTLSDGQFHGALAYCSLLHLPKKRMANALARITELLTDEGVFFIGMIKGEGENLYKHRFFAKYNEAELEEVLEEYFDIIADKELTLGSQTYLNYVCKKKTDLEYRG